MAEYKYSGERAEDLPEKREILKKQGLLEEEIEKLLLRPLFRQVRKADFQKMLDDIAAKKIRLDYESIQYAPEILRGKGPLHAEKWRLIQKYKLYGFSDRRAEIFIPAIKKLEAKKKPINRDEIQKMIDIEWDKHRKLQKEILGRKKEKGLLTRWAEPRRSSPLSQAERDEAGAIFLARSGASVEKIVSMIGYLPPNAKEYLIKTRGLDIVDAVKKRGRPKKKRF